MTIPPVLYHGTCASNLDSILERGGLFPRGKKRANDKTVSSHPKAVYLSEAYPIKFAFDAMGRGYRLAILEIITDGLDARQFAPDDDIVAQYWVGPHITDMRSRFKTARALMANDFKKEHMARESIRAAGSCAYFGSIPIEQVTRIALIDFEPQKWFLIGAADVGTGPLAYQFTKQRHLDRLIWLFDGVHPELPDMGDPEMAKRFFGMPESREGIEIIDLRKT